MFAPFILLGVILFALLIIFYFVPLGLWIQAIVSVGLGEITIVDLIRMRLRKIPPRLIVDSIINLNKAGLESISTGMMETHFLAGKFWAKKDKEWNNINEEIRAKYDLILAEEFGDVFNFSTGGTVTGPEGIDKVNVKLTAGEEVITKESASLFRPLLKDINNNAGEMWLSLEKGIKQQTVNNESQDKVNAEFNKILVGFNSQLAEISSNKQTGGSVSVSSRPPASPQIGGSSVSAVSKQVGSLQKSSSVSVVHLDIPSQNLDIDARSKQSEAPQTTLVKPSTTVLGDNIVPSPMDPYNSGRLSEAFDVYGIIG